jgi:hypothetical protein
MSVWFWVINLLCFTSFAQPRFQVVVSEQVIEQENERQARVEAIEAASKEVTYEAVKKQIGEARTQENKQKIDDEIQVLKNRFIPYIKILSHKKEKTDEGNEAYRFKIELKISENDLRTILQQKGLFASQSKTGITLPFFEVNNQLSGESYRWWAPVFTTSKELESFSLIFEQELFQGFLEKGLFLLRPQAFHMVHMIPDFMRKTYLTQTEMVQLTSLKQGQLYLDGRVDIMGSPLRESAIRVRVQLSCKQSSNGKSVAEVVRVFDSSTGKRLNQMSQDIKKLAEEAGEDLASQVYDLWQRGVLESETLQLAVTGNLNHQQLARFKQVLREKLGSESLTERLFEPGRVTFEMDYAGGVEALSKKLSQAKFEGFMSQVVSTQADMVTLEVKSTLE